MGFVDEELKRLKEQIKDIPFTEIITCHASMVQIRVSHTDHKQLVVLAQFPVGYPSQILLVELKSKTLPATLLDGLIRVCDNELQKHIGSDQVIPLLNFIHGFVASNAFIVCSGELSYIKKELVREGDEIKVKHKSGIVHYKAKEGRYLMDVVLTVPNDYPVTHVKFDLKSTSFPPDFVRVFTGHAGEMARQCVQPPVRRKPSDPPFQPKPSLQLIANYLVAECVRKSPREKCALCNKNALPEDPKDIITDDTQDGFVFRVYCSHMYHRGCLEVYTKTPPFEGGKKCLVCKERIFHDRWNVHPKLAEDRWAHQEARKREVAEVADFLGF